MAATLLRSRAVREHGAAIPLVMLRNERGTSSPLKAGASWTIGSSEFSGSDETLAQQREGSVSDFGPDVSVLGVAGISSALIQSAGLDEQQKDRQPQRRVPHPEALQRTARPRHWRPHS